MKCLLLLLICAAVPALATPPAPAIYYAAPNGTGSTCSSGSPCSVGTGCDKLKPGDILNLNGGTYAGKFTCKATGTRSNPVTVRSTPGQWAKIDGYYVLTTLAVSLPASRGDPVTLDFASSVDVPEGSVVTVGNNLRTEHLYLSGRQPGGKRWTNCARGWDGTAPSAHPAGAELRLSGDTFAIFGQYTNYRDFEVTSSDPQRSFNFRWGGLAPGVRAAGVTVPDGRGNKLINLVVHDTGTGIGGNVGAIDLEAYGCIIYNVGFVDWERGHGQGLYWQNERGQPQKKVRNVISFNNFTDGMKAYAESQYAQNLLYEHVISFNNGVLASFPGNQGGGDGSALPANHRYPNIYAGTGNSNNPINDIKIHDCYTYHLPDVNVEFGNVSLGYQAPNATGLEITNSRIMGGGNPLVLTHFLSGTVTGNKIYAQSGGNGVVAELNADNSPSFTWNNNTYFTQFPGYDGVQYPFRYRVGATQKPACDTGAPLKYTETRCPPNGGWKEHTGFDTNSRWQHARPSGVEAFLIPNEYDPNRWHMAIYNWDRNNSVSVSVVGQLNNGDSYALYAVEEGRFPTGTPTARGVVSGGVIRVPMSATPVVAPIGLGWAPPSVRPEFGVFILMRTAGGPTPSPGPSPVPTPTPVLSYGIAAILFWVLYLTA